MRLHPIDWLFGETWRMYKERFSVLSEILLVPVLIILLGYILVALGPIFSLVGILAVVLGYIIFIFATLPVIFSIHNKTGVDASYKETIPMFWPLVWIVILALCATFGGYIMLIIPGIWLAIATSFASYALVIEGRRGLDALRQSKEYVKGYWWAVLGRGMLIGLVSVVITWGIDIPVSLFVGKFAGILVSMVIVLVLVPYTSIYNYNIFQNLRELKPELADSKEMAGKGFLKASAIVGVVVPLLIAFGLILFASSNIARQFQDMKYQDQSNDPNVDGQYNTP
jgi:hypothetical protein